MTFRAMLLMVSITAVLPACGERTPPVSGAVVRVAPPAAAATLDGPFAGTPSCPIGPLVATGANHRVAFLVGNNHYRGTVGGQPIHELPGAENDVAAVSDLLVRTDGYSFPKENVCVLNDVTLATFRSAWKAVFADRGLRANDEVLVYYSGHGSQQADVDGDEPDGMDETLVMVDSRVNGTPDLTDDQFHSMLQSVHNVTDHLVVVLDSCNSGSASRGRDSPLARREIPPETSSVLATMLPTSPDARALDGDDLPGMVLISGARDGTSAHEFGGHGVLTSALLYSLADTADAPLTWEQIYSRAAPVVSSMTGGAQAIDISGPAHRVVFSNEERKRPLAWQVTKAYPDIQLAGIPMPGWSTGALLRVYDARLAAGDYKNPAKARGVIQLDAPGPLARAHLYGTPASSLQAGDLAFLVQPGGDVLAVRVRARPASERGGVDPTIATALSAALAERADLRGIVVEDPKGTWEISTDGGGNVQLRGPEGGVRRTFPLSEPDIGVRILHNLEEHAMQQALLALPTHSASLSNESSLRVEIGPGNGKHPCARPWPEEAASGVKVVPLCASYQLKISLADDASGPLRVGGAILSNDGSILGFSDTSVHGKYIVTPGAPVIVSGFYARPPLTSTENIVVVGTPVDRKIDWTQITVKRGPAPADPLAAWTARYLRGTRATWAALPDQFDWTSTRIQYRVEANVSQEEVKANGERDYTIKDFALAPYLPSDKSSALYGVLDQAAMLTRKNSRAQGGFPYSQHGWTLASDDANLALGIDCSRSIWFVFTRAGLPYGGADNPAKDYAAIAAMADPGGSMTHQFASCMGEPAHTGDVLVYRDAEGRDGHTVMVIDPVKRVVWGSNGWDGRGDEDGVQFQWLKYRKDFANFDRRGMDLVACWRHRVFIAEADAPGSAPGTYLDDVERTWCDDIKSCPK